MTCHFFNHAIAIGLVGLMIGCESRNPAQVPSEVVAKARPDIVEPTVNPEINSAPSNREDLLAAVTKCQEAGDINGAVVILRKMLVNDAQDFEAVFILANLQASQGKFDEAIELLGDIPHDHPDAGIPSLGASADWCMEIQRYDDAEQRYRKILELAPEFNIARRKLAQLLNREGRRHEANMLIRELCLAGDVTQDELHALIVESDAMYDEPTATPKSSEVAYTPIGPMGQARFLYTNQRYLDAANAVEPLVQAGGANPAVIAFYGCAAAEAQDDEKFAIWLRYLTEDTKAFPEYWAALGTHLITEGKVKESVRALGEALQRDVTDHRSLRRMVQAFRSLQDQETAERFIQRYDALVRSINASVAIVERSSSSQADFEKLSNELSGLDRRLESILWRSVAKIHHSTDPTAISDLNSEMKFVLSSSIAFPNTNQALCGLALQDFPLPESKTVMAIAKSTAGPSTSFAPPPASFLNVSDSAGLTHQYKIGSQPREKGFAIYQSFGGGVAVLDFDLDGYCDFHFAQGACDPPKFLATESDVFYRTIRNPSGMKLSDVTAEVGAMDARYTIGVTSGDWNQDGFPDIATSGIGGNMLLVNNGDGTFKAATLNIASKTKLSSSLAIADVNGDHLPDIFVANYVDDNEMTRTPEVDAQGNVLRAVSPFSFQPALDGLWINDGQSIDGQVQWTQSNVSSLEKDASTGTWCCDFKL